jgi:hypothetical protein
MVDASRQRKEDGDPDGAIPPARSSDALSVAAFLANHDTTFQIS